MRQSGANTNISETDTSEPNDEADVQGTPTPAPRGRGRGQGQAGHHQDVPVAGTSAQAHVMADHNSANLPAAPALVCQTTANSSLSLFSSAHSQQDSPLRSPSTEAGEDFHHIFEDPLTPRRLAPAAQLTAVRAQRAQGTPRFGR
jgi:hypothetical protein